MMGKCVLCLSLTVYETNTGTVIFSNSGKV